jgi:hypothetical protein
VRLRIPRLRKRQAIRISKASNRFKSHQIASASKWPKVSNRLGVRPPPRGQQSASTTCGRRRRKCCIFVRIFGLFSGLFLSSWYFLHLVEIMYIRGVGQRAAGLVLVRDWSNLLLRIPPGSRVTEIPNEHYCGVKLYKDYSKTLFQMTKLVRIIFALCENLLTRYCVKF